MQTNSIMHNNMDTKLKNNEIYSTTDYKMFNTVKGNREVSQRHVASLMSSISKRNMLHQNPILVTESMEVIDGQHRLQAARGLGVPIYYLILDNAGLSEVQQLNTYTKTWTSSDYLQSYISVGSPKYQEFKNFISEYQISIEAGFNLLFGSSDSETYRRFRDGTFNFTDEQMEAARTKADLISRLRSYFVDSGSRSTYFYRAVSVLYDKGLFEDFNKKLELANPHLKRQPTLREWLRMFEDVINWNQKSNIRRLF